MSFILYGFLSAIQKILFSAFLLHAESQTALAKLLTEIIDRLFSPEPISGTFPSLILISLLASYFGVTSIQTLYKYYNSRLLEPANWGTIIMHSVTGILLFVGIWLGSSSL